MDAAWAVWELLLERAAAPVGVSVLVSAAVAMLLMAVTPVWRVTRFVVTLGHEGAHAIAAVLTGRRLAGIRVHSDTSGVTVSRGRPRGPGMVLTTAAGYPGPALIGLLGVALITAGQSVAAVVGLMILLLAALLLVRNLIGGLVVVGLAAVVVAGLLLLPSGIGSAIPLVLCLVLLAGGVRSTLELGRARQSRRGATDADELARLTHVPAFLWVGAFVVADVACALAAGLLLAGPYLPSPI